MAYEPVLQKSIVLGGGGFLGSHLVQALLAKGHKVTSVDRHFSDRESPPSAKRLELDLLRCSDSHLADVLMEADVVYHLMWTTIPATAEVDPRRDMMDNVGFALRLLQVVRRHTRLVFTSSGGTIYGEPTTKKLAEDHPKRPVSVYGATKLAAELYFELYRRTAGLDIRIARLSNPYGPGHAITKPQGAVNRFVSQAVQGKVIEVWGDGQVVRDYIHVQDAVNCICSIGDIPRALLLDHFIFNVGSGVGSSLFEVLCATERIVGRKLTVRHLPERFIDIKRNVLCIERAKSFLDWNPSISLDQGISDLVESIS